MACFTGPAAVAVVTTIFRKKIPEKYHIGWLNMLLWGGTAGLALEHVAHQEIVFYFPYLTAMKTAADTATMIQEIITLGGGMLIACLTVWAVMVVVSNKLEEKASAETAQKA
jgi:hypothetical protein